ncbi:hypothetical protein ACPPVO_04465 [Dactylosporangium sp. McL0621]|uniref:hypothetical protein n=1 Tax=Dactylosporangium sp. McL0621 TaxID=3415678 RepID=UPI003CF41C1E
MATGKYVSSNYGVQPMAADRATIGAWEKFPLTVGPGGGGVTLRALANATT